MKATQTWWRCGTPASPTPTAPAAAGARRAPVPPASASHSQTAAQPPPLRHPSPPPPAPPRHPPGANTVGRQGEQHRRGRLAAAARGGVLWRGRDREHAAQRGRRGEARHGPVCALRPPAQVRAPPQPSGLRCRCRGHRPPLARPVAPPAPQRWHTPLRALHQPRQPNNRVARAPPPPSLPPTPPPLPNRSTRAPPRARPRCTSRWRWRRTSGSTATATTS